MSVAIDVVHTKGVVELIELTETLKLLEAYDLTLVVVGIGVLGLATLLHRFDDYPLSFPIVALALGYVAFSLPLGLKPPNPQQHGAFAVHLTEIGVIVSLMGVGLKIDRFPHWRSWSSTWRMLGICMPLTIACCAVLGWSMVGLAPAAAVLLGAALAPTDPVLATDVQVGEPEAEVSPENDAGEQDEAMPSEDRKEKEDELKFTLTSEAGLNDSLAFPFTYLALAMVAHSAGPGSWLVEWLVVDVGYRILVGAATGVALGWGLSNILLRLPVASEREMMKAGIGALAGTLLLYSITECLGGYGFLAVFIGGLTIRHRERRHESHRSMHTFAEQSEQLLMTGILIALGGAVAGGLLEPLTWEAAFLGVLMVFVVRPAAGMIGLLGEQRLSGMDRGIASAFGIRGIGCLYYLAYGVEEGSFPQEDLLWATCAFTVVLSVCLHGATSASVIRFRDQQLQGAGKGKITS